MTKKRVLIAITNRSSYNKVKTVIANLPEHIEPELLLGGSVYLYQYGDVGKIIEDDFPDIKKWKVSMMVEGDTNTKMPMSVGVGCLGISTILDNNKYDLIVTVADRFETLATATAASYTNIPLAHIQGGEISGTIDDKVRNAITQLADYHFPATYDAADRVANMKMQDMERIWSFGCPSMDIMISNPIVKRIYTNRAQGYFSYNHFEGMLWKELIPVLSGSINRHGVGPDIDFSKKYIIIMMHPDTTGDTVNDEHMAVVMEALNNFGCQKIIFWNNIDPGGNIIAKNWRMSQHDFWKDKTKYIRHVTADVFGALMINAEMIVGNSSAGIREATFFGTPSVSIGERQKGRDHGINVRYSSFSYSELMHCMEASQSMIIIPNDMYGFGNAGKKIADKVGDIVYERLVG